MSVGSTLMDFGIAINFFGNYRRESSALENSTKSLHNSLLSLQNIVVGGAIGAALYGFTNSLLNAMQRVEMQFAQLKTSLGSVERATETLRWAKKMGMETALESAEVVDAVVAMTRMGLASDKEARDKNFRMLADFTAQYAKPRGMSFQDVVDSVTKASFGNWERLGDNFGIRKQTIGVQMQNAITARGIDDTGKNPLAFSTKEVERAKDLIKIIQTGKQGTNEFKMAIVEVLGLMSKGGMNEQLKTIQGTWSNIKDVSSLFIENIVGITQVTGSLANKINESLNKFYNMLSLKNKEGVSALDNIMRFATDIGGLLTSVWGGVSSAVGGVTSRIVGFLRDYNNNIAPIVLFLALIKLQVIDFAKGFWEGFKLGFLPFIKLAGKVWQWLVDIAAWLGIGETKAETFGKVVGTLLGVLGGIKVFKILVSPFTMLITSAQTAIVWVTRLATSFWSVIVATWQWTAALLVNPVTWIVLGVIALIAAIVLLIMNWDKVKAWFLKMVSQVTSWFTKQWNIAKDQFRAIWNGLKDFFISIWNGIKDAFSGVWGAMSDVYTGVINGIHDAFEAIWRKITGMWDTMKGWLTDISDWIGGLFGRASDGADEAIAKINAAKIGVKPLVPAEMYGNWNNAGMAGGKGDKTETVNNTYTFGTLTLPNVTKPSDFMPELNKSLNRTGKK